MVASARNLNTSLKMSDGTGAKMGDGRPKSARLSVCQRATAASSENCRKVTEKGKKGTGFTLGGKFETDRMIQGSRPRTGAKSRSDAEKGQDTSLMASTSAASAGRAAARSKAAVCESDGKLMFLSRLRFTFVPRMLTLPHDQV